MSAHLNLFFKTFAYSDGTASNAPTRRNFDWSRQIQGLPCTNPKSSSLTIDPSSSLTIFGSIRAIALDNTTQLAITVSPVDPTVYRFTWTTVGTNPAFRTPHVLTLSGTTMTVTRNSNSTATFAASTASLGAVMVGDTVFIPGISTGDAAGPFNPLNEGYWIVLTASSNQLVMARPANTVFSAASEVVAITNNSQLFSFTSTGVQVGDQVQISAGFSVGAQRTFGITAVTPTFFEVLSPTPLAIQTAIPTTSGIAIYGSSKRYLRIEADQQIVVQLNGSTSTNTPMIAPFVAGDSDQVGWFEFVGTAYSLTLLNKSLSPAHVEILSVE